MSKPLYILCGVVFCISLITIGYTIHPYLENDNTTLKNAILKGFQYGAVYQTTTNKLTNYSIEAMRNNTDYKNILDCYDTKDIIICLDGALKDTQLNKRI